MGLMAHKKKLIIILLIVFSAIYVGAENKLITYGQAYEKNEPRILGNLPTLKGWYDADYYLEEDNDAKNGVSRLFKVNAQTGKASVLLDYNAWQDQLPAGIRPGDYLTNTAGYTGFLYDHHNDLYYFEPGNNVFRQLTKSSDKEINATFSPDGKRVAFTRAGNLFVVDVMGGNEQQLTFDSSLTVYNGYASWVYYEEILGRKSKYKAFWWSPASDRIAFMRFDDSDVPEFPLFCADGVHGNLEIQHYPKAGDPVPLVKLGIADIQSGETVWADSGEVSDEYLGTPQWTSSGSSLILQWKNRRQNQLKLFLTDPFSGKSTVIYEEKQESWVEFLDEITVAEGRDGIFLISDQSGLPGIYQVDLAGKQAVKITGDDVGVTKIVYADVKNRLLYFEGWQGNSAENHLFHIGFNGRELQHMSETTGIHSCLFAPDGNYYYDKFSNISQPDKIELRSGSGKKIRTIGDAASAGLEYANMGKVEMFTIPTADGIDLPALWILPSDFDPHKRYPVLFKVYGGPGRNSVKNEFQRISDHYLAQYGLIIIKVDHRGSAHFGKDGKMKMYRQLGKYELDDLIEAVKWLRGLTFVDSTKIAITGASYGGYVTCLALTRGADYFSHGMAYYSVTDWQLYDAVYTERFMDLPANNPDGYKFGSAMTHAGGYKGELMLIHGSMDDNVHVQNSVQLVDKLTDFERAFEFVLIPDSRHGTTRSKRKFIRMKDLEFVFERLLNRPWPGWDR